VARRPPRESRAHETFAHHVHVVRVPKQTQHGNPTPSPSSTTPPDRQPQPFPARHRA
jgi:hypothetical protein